MGELPTAIELNLDAPWSVGEATFDLILREFRRVAPTTILEFGSGISSVRLAMAFPDARIVSIDHEEKHLNRTRDLAAEMWIKNLELLLCPIIERWYGAAWYESYDLPELNGECFDAVLIDGPPARYFFGREACLYQCHKHIRTEGVLILDDYERPAEQMTLRNWELRYPGNFSATVENVGHGVLTLRKCADHRFAASLAVPLNNSREWIRRYWLKHSPKVDPLLLPARLRLAVNLVKAFLRRMPFLRKLVVLIKR